MDEKWAKKSQYLRMDSSNDCFGEWIWVVKAKP